MIAALTWAAAQDRIPVHELIRGLTPTDERRIEAAYAEWRRRAAAGEKRPKVDWHSYPVPDIPSEDGTVPAQSVTAVATHPAKTSPADEKQDDDSTTDADPDVIDAVEQILAAEAEEPEYISLDDFNLEPSEAEMREMEKALKAETVVYASVEETGALNTTISAESGETVEQRISKLGKDATSSNFAALLDALGNDVDMAKAVTEAVIKDHTVRHRGTASQRAFLAWLRGML